MPARTMLLAVALSAACLVPACLVPARAHDLTVVPRGATAPDAVLAQVVASPFTGATGIPVLLRKWNGGLDTLSAQLKAPDNTWDVVELNPEELATACGQGQLEKLDWSAIGGKGHYLPQGVSDCGVGADVVTLVLAWDRAKLPVAPTWADFWDVAKYPGKRGLQKGVRGNLEFALIADGVAPADVYKVLATTDGVNRAFRKLDQLKPYIVWWQTPEQAAQILRSGDVLMTSAPAGQIVLADAVERRNFGIQWASGLYWVDSWAMVRGSANLTDAEQYLYFLGLPSLQARLFLHSGMAGVAKGTNDSLSPQMQALFATNPKNLAAAVPMDVGFWHDNLAKLQARFDSWLAGH